MYEVVVMSAQHQGLFVAHQGIMENVAQHIYEICCSTVKASGGTALVTLKEAHKTQRQALIEGGREDMGWRVGSR